MLDKWSDDERSDGSGLEWSGSEWSGPGWLNSKEWWERIPFAADPSRLPKLPTEVWERVLDECDVLFENILWDRDRTFSAGCLTCRAWLPRSRYHLFKYVAVRSKEQIKQVSKLLRSIPALRTRVEVLYVVGSKDGKRDASWIGLVGFHLGPKLKALTGITIQDVDFSLMKIEAYKFWGAFNRAWRPDATPGLLVLNCSVTHLNQPIRLAFAAKTKTLTASQNEQSESGLPAPVLPSGISLPLSKFELNLPLTNHVLSMPWHTLPKQCPSLSSVKIWSPGKSIDLSSPDCQLFLVSILCMFYRMQRHNDTNVVTLQADSLPQIEMRTRPYHKSANSDRTPLATQSHLHRELVLSDPYSPQYPMVPFVKSLTSLGNAMVLANYTNRRFRHIEISSNLNIDDLQPDSFESLDGVLSHLLIAAHDVHLIMERSPPQGCVAPWARERFPALTAIVPNAFCDPEAGQPCKSHPKQENGIEKG